MKNAKLLLCAVLALCVTTGAFGVLDTNGSKLTNIGENLRVSVNFAGIEIDYGEVFLDTGGSVTLGNGGALGYVPAAVDPSPSGTGMFVLYDSAGTVIADVNSSGVSSAPGVFPNLGAVLADPRNVFKTFGLGTIDNLQNPDGTVVSFPETFPGAPATTQQLSFVFRDLELTIASPTPANFEASLQFDPVTTLLLGTGTLSTTFRPGTGMFSIYEDATTDVDSRAMMIPAAGGAPAGELPTSFLDPDGTGLNEYFDPADRTDSSPFRYSDPTDAQETEVLRLAHTGGMIATDAFNSALRGPLHVGNGAPVIHPLFGPITMFSGGRSAFSDNGPSLFPVGGSWLPYPVSDEEGFRITSDVAFGLSQTDSGFDPGALPEDPDTFTFQTPLGGGPEIFGGRVVIPEPLTMLGLLLGGGSLAGYLRKRRS